MEILGCPVPDDCWVDIENDIWCRAEPDGVTFAIGVPGIPGRLRRPLHLRPFPGGRGDHRTRTEPGHPRERPLHGPFSDPGDGAGRRSERRTRPTTEIAQRLALRARMGGPDRSFGPNGAGPTSRASISRPGNPRGPYPGAADPLLPGRSGQSKCTKWDRSAPRHSRSSTKSLPTGPRKISCFSSPTTRRARSSSCGGPTGRSFGAPSPNRGKSPPLPHSQGGGPRPAHSARDRRGRWEPVRRFFRPARGPGCPTRTRNRRSSVRLG